MMFITSDQVIDLTETNQPTNLYKQYIHVHINNNNIHDSLTHKDIQYNYNKRV